MRREGEGAGEERGSRKGGWSEKGMEVREDGQRDESRTLQ